MEILRRENDKEINAHNTVALSQQKNSQQLQNKLDELTRMHYRQLIDDEHFARERDRLQNKIASCRECVKQTEERANNWLEMTEKIFSFAVNAREHFNTDDNDKKHEILRTLGTEFSLTAKKLAIKLQPWLQSIVEEYTQLEKEYRTFEPSKQHALETSPALNSIRTRWQVHQDVRLCRRSFACEPCFAG